MRTQLAALVVAAGVALTTACGAPAAPGGPGAGAAGAGAATPAAPAGAQRVTVVVDNSMHFAPPALVVRAGQPVELTLRNGGGLPHDFALAEGASRPVKIETPAGRTSRGAFTIETPGTYAFVCTVPGHADAGMRGTLTAQ